VDLLCTFAVTLYSILQYFKFVLHWSL